jgi:hypothetical protein
MVSMLVIYIFALPRLILPNHSGFSVDMTFTIYMDHDFEKEKTFRFSRIVYHAQAQILCATLNLFQYDAYLAILLYDTLG